MEILSLFFDNLLSPAILFFTLGVVAGLIKSDLEVPDQISRYLSIYLMMAIGFKGGAAIAATESFDGQMFWTFAAGLVCGFVQPLLGYVLLRLTTKIDRATAAAVAAHYGSISMVTFITAASFLDAHNIVYAGYMVAVLALMEAPAIFSGLFLAYRYSERAEGLPVTRIKMGREILTNGAIVLLVGAMLIGWLSGDTGYQKMEGFLVTPFQGILALFLLDMGIMVAKEWHHLKSFTFSLFMFAIYMPVIGAATGLLIAMAVGVGLGEGLLLMCLLASASYIAVPAAMRIALPQAKAGIYVPMTLAITFPFNISIGIPVYYTAAQMFLG